MVSLKDLRKAAGYHTALEFAELMGVPSTTYSRYEQKPSHIPLRQAIAFADFLDAPLDAVVGRERESGRGPQQHVYDMLSPRGRAACDEFMAYQLFRDRGAQ